MQGELFGGQMSSVVLIDGKNLAYRMHYTHRHLSANGFPTSILYGTLSGMLSLAKRLKDVPFIWLWDGDGSTWRHELAAGTYKANRVALPKDVKAEVDRMHRQLPVLKKFLVKTGFRVMEVPNLECDDLIGIVLKIIQDKKLFEDVIIHSGDRDFYQFIGDGVRQLKGLKDGNLHWANPDDIKSEFGVSFRKWTKLRALIGDKSDNILPVFRGVGPVTAAKFIKDGIDPSVESFDDLPKKVRKVYSHKIVIRGNEINFKEDWDKVHLNYKLSRIVTDREDECLPTQVRKDLKSVCKNLSRKSFFRDPDCCDDEGWRYMTEFLSRYDMDDLMGRRDRLWAMP